MASLTADRRWTPRVVRRAAGALPIALGVALIAGCGGSKVHHVAGLPTRAHVLFASDRPLQATVKPGAHLAGTQLASLGFDPTRDGFSFQNYGFIAGADLDARAMRAMFGDQVCATTPSDTCTLTPQAQQWAEGTADQMIGGHCFGFSMTALRFFEHMLGQSQFGGTTTYSLGFTPALQSEIAQTWATQVIPDGSVQQETRGFTPTATINFLQKALADRSGPVYSLGIRSAPGGEGHAITPIGVERLGGGSYAIDVYDNNWPGTTREVLVNESADTWSYALFPDLTWNGQGTNNELALTPLSAALAKQPCPFCNGSQGKVMSISLAGNPVDHGHLLITAADGRHLGYVNGKFVDQIKGARVIRPYLNELWKADPEPIYEVPADDKLTVTLNGAGATGNDAAAVHITGPGFGATVADLRPQAGSRDQIAVSPGGGQISLKVSGDAPGSKPTVQLARGSGRAGSQLQATPTALAGGAQLTIGLDPASNRLIVHSSHSTQVALATSNVSQSGALKSAAKIALNGGHTATLSLHLTKKG